MRNLYRMQSAPDAIVAFARELGRQLSFPESFEPRDVRISERAPLLRAGPTADTVELVERRWSWPGATGKPCSAFAAKAAGSRPTSAAWCWPTGSTSSPLRPTRGEEAAPAVGAA